MSSLWTPGGEVPVGRDRPGADAASPPDPPPTSRDGAPPGGGPVDGGPVDEAAAQEELSRFLRATPAADVIAQHAAGMYELAVLHLSQEAPRLEEASLAIDALGALVEGLEGRLGPAEAELRAVLPQLRMAFVQVADRVRGAGDAASGDDGG